MMNLIINGDNFSPNVPPSTTMLDYIRDHLGLKGTKEGCGEGDCGACTILRISDGKLHAINSCLMQVGQADGGQFITVEGLAKANQNILTPIQLAIAEGGGTQCGFCTPGIVTALFALIQSDEEITEEAIHETLAGNLCRCTGYLPIIEAAKKCDRTKINFNATAPTTHSEKYQFGGQTRHAPSTLRDLLEILSSRPDAVLFSGGTDMGLRFSKGREKPDLLIDASRVKELNFIEETKDSIRIGAAVTYTAALPEIERLYPSFADIIRRIGSKQIRNLGTIGGNIGTASPIGDTLPCLIALDAKLTLFSLNGVRELAIEDFFKDYRKTSLGRGEVIHSVSIPKLASDQIFRSYKIAKRYDQDISTVIAAFRLELTGQIIKDLRIAFGGMGPVPARSPTTEKFLENQVWNEDSLVTAGDKIADDFSPISDHRGTSEYRLTLATNLLQKFFWDISAPNTNSDLFKS